MQSCAEKREAGAVGRAARRDLRSELLEAGEAVFAASGFSGTSVDDVIRAAHTSRATFYRYFASKEALFEELSRECFRQMRSVVRALAQWRSGPATQEGLEAVLLAYTTLHERHRGVIRAWNEQSGPSDAPIRALGRRALEALVAETAKALHGAVEPAFADPGTSGNEALRAALLFTLIERSSAYVASRSSKIRTDRLSPTLATMIRRAYLP